MADAKTEEEKAPVVVIPWNIPVGSTQNGIVTFYHNRKMWGRISPDSIEGSPSIFFHSSGFTGGRIRPREGYGVSFTAVNGDDGRLKASDISLDAAAVEANATKKKEGRRRGGKKAGGEAKADGANGNAEKKEEKKSEKKEGGSSRQRKSGGGAKDASADASAASGGAPKAEKVKVDRREITVNASLVGDFPESTPTCSIKLILDADRIMSSLKKKCCRAMKVSEKKLEMLTSSGEPLKLTDFDGLASGASFILQITRSKE